MPSVPYAMVIRANYIKPAFGITDTLVYIGPPGGSQIITPVDLSGNVDSLNVTDTDFYGPLFIGSAIYVWGQAAKVTVYKSTDNGVSFVALDASNGPRPNDITAAVVDGTSRIIFSGNPSGTGGAFLQDFNLGSGTWGAAYATGGTTDLVQLVRKISNGNIYIFCLNGSSAYTYGFWNGSSWSAQAPFSQGSIGALQAAPVGVTDPSDGTTLVYSTGAGAQTYARRIDSSNTLGSPFSFPATQGGDPVTGNGVIAGANIRVPFVFANPMNPSNIMPQDWIGAPFATPSWSEVIVDSDPLDDLGYNYLVQVGGVTTHFWIWNNFTQVSYAVDGGSGYGARSLFYDFVANPPPIPTPRFMEGLSVVGMPVSVSCRVPARTP